MLFKPFLFKNILTLMINEFLFINFSSKFIMNRFRKNDSCVLEDDYMFNVTRIRENQSSSK